MSTVTTLQPTGQPPSGLLRNGPGDEPCLLELAYAVGTGALARELAYVIRSDASPAQWAQASAWAPSWPEIAQHLGTPVHASERAKSRRATAGATLSDRRSA